MQKSFLAVIAAGVLTLSACQTAPTTTAKPELSDEAKIALSWAEADLKDAAKANNVWTTAEAALKSAKEAAEKGDSANTIKHAKTASAQAKLGIAQTKYPPVKIGN